MPQQRASATCSTRNLPRARQESCCKLRRVRLQCIPWQSEIGSLRSLFRLRLLAAGGFGGAYLSARGTFEVAAPSVVATFSPPPSCPRTGRRFRRSRALRCFRGRARPRQLARLRIPAGAATSSVVSPRRCCSRSRSRLRLRLRWLCSLRGTFPFFCWCRVPLSLVSRCFFAFAYYCEELPARTRVGTRHCRCLVRKEPPLVVHLLRSQGQQRSEEG